MKRMSEYFSLLWLRERFMKDERRETPALEAAPETPRKYGISGRQWLISGVAGMRRLIPDALFRISGRQWLIGAGLAGLFFILSGGVFLSHGTVEGATFCNTCHTAYYDAKEYAFNDKVGMKKPSGVLTGCAECHPQPYAEFKKSAHFETKLLERRPGCANCHNNVHSVFAWYRFMYWQPVAWKKVQAALNDNGLWNNEVRPKLAGMARAGFVESESRACKGCHTLEAKTFRPDIRAHKGAATSGETCIRCHFNLVHAEVPWPDKDKK
jgi:nitrate/TMAO reductase-like tetraheme cytochrome c subunit